MKFREKYNRALEQYAKKFGINPYTGNLQQTVPMEPMDVLGAGFQMFQEGAKAALEILKGSKEDLEHMQKILEEKE